MHRKRILAGICILLILLALPVLSACAAPMHAAHEPTVSHPTSPVPLTCQGQGELVESALTEGSGEAARYLSSAAEIEQYIYKALLAEQEEIDLAAFKIPTDRITQIFTDVMNRYPDLFFVQSGISYTYTSTGHIVTLKPSYRMTGKALEAANAEVELLLEKICAGVDRTWSDFEIALYLHDYLCLHFAYDTNYQIYDMYGFLTEGKGVCQAYTLTYTSLLSRYGIASDVAVSGEMNHIWNVVTLGGQPYHVDVTWDDPIPNKEGQALHQNFLRSDAGIAQTGHYAWVSDAACTQDAYESTFVTGVNTPFAYTAGQWFYADGAARTLYAVDFATMRAQSLVETDEKWLTPDGGSYYLDAFWGVGTYRGNVVYNTPDRIFAQNLQSGVIVEIGAELPAGMQIFGLWVEADTVYYSVSDVPDGEMQTLFCSIADLADYVWGDADQNGTVDGRDVSAMLRYLASLPTVCHTGAADLDDSGEVDARDVEILRQYLVENN